MSIFSRIKDAIFGHGRSGAASPAAPSGGMGGKPAAAQRPPNASGIPASPANAQWEREVDVEAVLESRAAINPQKLNWRSSIVDLM